MLEAAAVITRSSSSSSPGIREKQLLSFHAIPRNLSLSFVRKQEIDETLPDCRLGGWVLRRIHQYQAVLVVKPGIAFHQQCKIVLVAKADPRGAIGYRVRGTGNGDIKCGPHTLPHCSIPPGRS